MSRGSGEEDAAKQRWPSPGRLPGEVIVEVGKDKGELNQGVWSMPGSEGTEKLGDGDH